jgi:MoaA/NifB/PqqE/SkfB family radical SAM enzyme
MCTNPDRPWPAWDGSFGYDYDSIIKRLEGKREILEKTEVLYLSGGEPTLNPRFLDILTYLNDEFPKLKITLLTNGRTFLYEDLARKVLDANNLSIAMSLHGHTESVHDLVTGIKGSFVQMIKGLRNVLNNRKNGQEVEIRIIITGLTYKYVENIINMALNNFPEVDRFVLIFLEMEGQALKNIKKISLKYGDFLPYLKNISETIRRSGRIRLYHFPLCVVPFELWPYVSRTLPEDEVTFLPGCDSCQYRKYCMGIHKMYLENISKKGFNPVNAKIKISENDNFHQPINEAAF